MESEYDVRRLTPTECARLQGFPEEFIIPVSNLQAYKQCLKTVLDILLPLLHVEQARSKVQQYIRQDSMLQDHA